MKLAANGEISSAESVKTQTELFAVATDKGNGTFELSTKYALSTNSSPIIIDLKEKDTKTTIEKLSKDLGEKVNESIRDNREAIEKQLKK